MAYRTENDEHRGLEAMRRTQCANVSSKTVPASKEREIKWPTGPQCTVAVRQYAAVVHVYGVSWRSELSGGETAAASSAAAAAAAAAVAFVVVSYTRIAASAGPGICRCTAADIY